MPASSIPGTARMMRFSIENHVFRTATGVNRVVCAIACDVHETLWMGREGFALELAAMEVGGSRDFARIQWQGETRTGPIRVTRDA